MIFIFPADLGLGAEELGCRGTPTIVGTPGDDQLIGTESWDVIHAGSGNDIVYGNGGHDTLCGDGGNDLVVGGSGEDEVMGGGGQDELRGGPGEDFVMDGSGGADLLKGGSADDQVEDLDGNDFNNPYKRVEPNVDTDRLRGGSGDDRILSPYGGDFIDGGVGDDRCLVDRRVSKVACEERTNWIAWWNTKPPPNYFQRCFGKEPTLVGTPLDDAFDTKVGGEVIMGRGGNDDLEVDWDYSGTDTLCGGPGDDYLGSYAGNEKINGGPGDDYLVPGYGDDLAYGGPGDDRVDDWDEGAVSGTDTWFMGPGADTVKVEDGNDVVFGGPGPDTIADLWNCERTYLHGNGGDDTFDAFADWDSYGGGTCNDPPDYVYGEGGSDQALVNTNDYVYDVEEIEVKEADDEQ